MPLVSRGADACSAPRSQVSGSQCVAFDQPATVRACATTPCTVAGQNLSLVYSPWTLCGMPCDLSTGYADRSAACVSVQGWLAAVDACPAYSGTITLLLGRLSTCKLAHAKTYVLLNISMCRLRAALMCLQCLQEPVWC